MIEVDYCPACNSKHLEKLPSKLYPFVVDRMTGATTNPQKPNHNTETMQCQSCGFMGITTRFDREEENRYYSDYMSESYNQHRTAYEGTGWLLYQNYYDSPEYIAVRKQAALDVLSQAILVDKIESVLDYGGNTGEMVPDEFSNAQRYVKDVNKRTLVNGFEAITDPSESGPVELVMCSHVLEHVSYPTELLNDIKTYLVPGGCVYIEVPSEWPGEMAHEHINYLTFPFLQKFLNDNGFEVLMGSEINYPEPMTASLAIVGRLK